MFFKVLIFGKVLSGEFVKVVNLVDLLGKFFRIIVCGVEFRGK